MTTPPAQEPRPGFTPRSGQARPGARGDSRWPNDPGQRGDVEDYWLDGRGSGARPSGGPSGNRPSFSPAQGGNRAATGNRAPDFAGPGGRDPRSRDQGRGDGDRGGADRRMPYERGRREDRGGRDGYGYRPDPGNRWEAPPPRRGPGAWRARWGVLLMI